MAKKKYVRFLNQEINSAQQDLLKSYMSEAIYSYGVDFIYWRKHIDTFQTPAISSEFYNHTYGELPDAPYNISGEIIAHLQVNADDWIMSQMGIQNTGAYTISFLCDEFTESFRQKIGVVTSGDISGIVSGNIPENITGDLLNYEIDVAGIVSNSDIEGYVNQTLTLNDYSTFISDVHYKEISPNSRFIIPPTYESTCEITGQVTGNLSLYDRTLSGIVNGSIIYKNNVAIMSNPDWKLAPQVGDIFEMKGLDPNLPREQYEVTRVIDKNLSDDEMNPLLGRYIWKCDCVRRTPSSEDFYSNDESGNPIENMGEYIEDGTNDNLWQQLENENLSNTIFDYEKPEEEEERNQDDVDIQKSNFKDISKVYGEY